MTVDPVPLLERAPAITHSCSEVHPMTQRAGATSSRIEGLTVAGGSFFTLDAADTLRVTEVGLDGMVGGSADLVTEAYAFRAPLAIRGGGTTALWSAPGESVAFAHVDATLNLSAGPDELALTAASQSAPAAVAEAPSGELALFYGRSEGNGQVTLTFLLLDADGAPLGEPKAIANVGETYIAEAAATATDDGGFAVAFSVGTGGQEEVDFTIVDADGTLRFAPRRISQAPTATRRSSMNLSPRQSLIRVGDRYWVAFTETDADYMAEKGSTIVRVAQVEADGTAVLAALEAPVDQEESLWPSFELFDGMVGLTWTKGHVIWICGGCISDHDMHFVLLDPTTMAPASEVVTHTHLTNGITAPLVASAGQDLLTAANLDFHAVTLPATGALRCTPN